jgi:hypothetical protein
MMRVLFAALLALSLTLLPAASLARAEPAPMSCHGDAQHPLDKARACAEHCLMLVTAAQPAPTPQPSVANAVSADRAMRTHMPAPQTRVAPETPPPRQ